MNGMSSPGPTLQIHPALFAALASAALLVAGCHSALEPSVHERFASFRQQQRAFVGDPIAVVLETYLVIAGGPGAWQPSIDSATGALRLPPAPQGAYVQGLGVGIDPGGYLLTARHVLRERLFVVGWINGRLDVRPASVVAMGAPSIARADFAVVRIPGRLDYTARYGMAPRRGDPVFAVVCNRGRDDIGGELGLAGGTVVDGGLDASGRTDPLIATDIPLWHGDSGGPLLSSAGNFVGINSAIEFSWLSGGYFKRLSFYPEEALVRRIIAADKARGPGPAGAVR